jgi:uncharacterized LabA/DUF88 family protein
MRASLYVDGFNLYHAIDDLNDNRLKWLSLQQLGNRIIWQNTETLSQVVYFSAYAHHLSAQDPSIVARHRQYVRALESTDVKVVLGNFKRKPRVCRSCNARWDSHEEKETDVNIAVHLVADAFRDLFDVAYVLPADTDLVPAMQCVRSVSDTSGKTKQVVAIFPPMQNRNVQALVQNSDRQIRLNQNHISQSRFPDDISLPDGTILHCPMQYK